MKSGKKETLREIGEQGALRAIRRFVAETGGDVAVGFGDDTAAVQLRQGLGRLQLQTADMLVEGVHFLPAHASWESIGRKAMAVNLSDIAAMGGRPAHALVSVGLPPSFLKTDLIALFRGLRREARSSGAQLVGGDMVRAAQVTIHVALLGWAKSKRALALRSKCRAGQHLYASGTLGDSAAGLALLTESKLKRHRNQPWAKTLIRRHLCPTPRLRAGQALAEAFGDLAMIDLSDGLAHECRLLSEASNVAIRLEAASAPLSPALRRFGQETGREARAIALQGGEDYELLFTVRAEEREIRALFGAKKIRLRLTRIGEVLPGSRRLEIQDSPDKIQGFEHF